MTMDRERANRILEELRSRPGLYLELLHQMTDAGEVLEPWEPKEDGLEWVRRGLQEVTSGLWGDKEREVIAFVKGWGGHYFAEVQDPDDKRMCQVEEGPGEYGSRSYCFHTLDEAFQAADIALSQHGYLLPPSREGAIMSGWSRPKNHSWESLTAIRVGHGCPGVGMVILRRPAPGEPPYEAMVDGEPLPGENYYSERLAMDACDAKLRRKGYVLP